LAKRLDRCRQRAGSSFAELEVEAHENGKDYLKLQLLTDDMPRMSLNERVSRGL